MIRSIIKMTLILMIHINNIHDNATNNNDNSRVGNNHNDNYFTDNNNNIDNRNNTDDKYDLTNNNYKKLIIQTVIITIVKITTIL